VPLLPKVLPEQMEEENWGGI